MSLEITHIQGGMREFERTGIYPEYLLFNLPGTRQNWRIRIKQTPQEGVLKTKGKALYEYSFDGNWCKYRIVNDDGSFSEWRGSDDMIIEMRD
ncbi:hypothetical protein LB467_11920 [Salegentibacter sp. JZCK2]|uniref:hypothetical protein n=1 Tax=Salegentibacter tibetensis TaxID=2873600 RepID=UPI001CCDA76F|nr:hypothetical protein [Salegentibacter tibetensis]MBZ9730393.1 hypothetical protein [Salegentibacter tibetensis]